ncbi:MAG: hypothetical protein AABY22_34945, partial [Nanoarchaeota archaeon]
MSHYIVIYPDTPHVKWSHVHCWKCDCGWDKLFRNDTHPKSPHSVSIEPVPCKEFSDIEVVNFMLIGLLPIG